MTGSELKALRKRSGLGWAEFGAAIGYGGSSHTISRKMKRLEGMADEDLPPDVARKVRAFVRNLGREEMARMESWQRWREKVMAR